MLIAFSDLTQIQFPDRAGELQRAASTAALIRELGTNYVRYNGFLAAELAKFGHPPEPREYGSFEKYSAAWARVHRLVVAEVLLRNCRTFLRTGEGLGAPYDPSTPLLDESNRLISIETHRPAALLPGS